MTSENLYKKVDAVAEKKYYRAEITLLVIVDS